MYEIPASVLEYGNALRIARDVSAGVARDEIVGWMVALATAGGACRALGVMWAFYTVIGTAIALYTLASAAGRLASLS